MKKLLIAGLLCLGLNAKVIDKIIVTVNDIPITTYELAQTAKKMDLTKEKALNYLIDKKLILSEIKRRNISVDDFEIENAMENIAKQNGMSLFEFKNILLQRGELDSFKKKLKENLLKQKLFDQIVQTKLGITPEEIKSYYQTHKNDFKIFKTVQVTKYSANNSEILKKIKENPLSNLQVKTQNEVFSYNELPLGLLFLFKQTKVGEYTPIINDGLGYSMFYIARKDSQVYLPLDKVENIIRNKLIEQKREMILKDYFDKLRNRAYIKFFN